MSGNPSGKAKRYDAARSDGWINDYTAFGVVGRDKTLGSPTNTAFMPDVVGAEDALQFWRGDAIAARIIELVPNEALRQGWELTIGEDEPPDTFKPPEVASPQIGTQAQGTPASPPPKSAARTDSAGGNAGAKDLQELVTKKLQDIGLLGALREALCYERAYGGGAILIGANDYTTDLREPLDLERVRSIDWLTPLEPRELIPRYYYNNPRAPKFGQPAIYQLQPYQIGAPIDGNYGASVTEIHESRLIVFPGIRVSRRMSTSGIAGWGDSVLTRIVASLSAYRSSQKSAALLLSDFSQAVMKIKGLAELLAQDGNGALLNKMISMDMMRSVARAILIDADGEDFERKATPMTGFAETVDRLAQALAADADMPLTLLFGMSPAGMNATGESDIRFFYDRVGSVRELRIAPAINRIVEIAIAAEGEDPETTHHAVQFPSLWQPTEKETAEAHFIQSQADANYLDREVVSPEEIALSRFGGPKFSFDTKVDFDARAEQEAIVAPTVEAKPEPIPPVGINAPALVEEGAMPDAAKKPTGAPPVRIEE